MGQTKPSVERVEKLTPEQMQRQQQLGGGIDQYLEQALSAIGYDITGSAPYQQGAEALETQLAAFDPEQTASVFEQNIGDPSRRAFEERVAPGIAERYSGRGGASQLILGGAATDLERNLAAQKSQSLLSAEQQKEQIRNQAIQQALGYAGAPGEQGLSALDRYIALYQQAQQSPYEIGVNQGSPGLLPGLIEAGGTIAGAYAGNPALGNLAGKKAAGALT